jgi:ribosome assembly protein YihI (activator of Der GTPase)
MLRGVRLFPSVETHRLAPDFELRRIAWNIQCNELIDRLELRVVVSVTAAAVW